MSIKTQQEINAEEEERLRRERAAAARAAKIRELKSEITDLENLRAQYVKLSSDVSSLSGNLSSLSGNLNNSANSLSKGLVLDGIVLEEERLYQTSQKSSSYAKDLENGLIAITTKIREIDLKIEEKRAQLRNL